MTAFRFLHSSDLHLGRPFASLAEPEGSDLRARLREARHQSIARLAQAARDHGAGHIVLAGDTFDSATPAPATRRQMCAAVAEAADLTWWLLPGNHDNLRSAEPLWETLAQEAPQNLRLLTDAAPRQMAPGVTLLPVPVTHRAPGHDLTAGLVQAPSPEGDLRLGLAHGGVVDFGEDAAAIPPDRDRSAALDYLALGDWHGRLAVSPRIHYPGSPEQDRFKHNRRGLALAVTLPGPGAPPEVVEIELGQFLWQAQDLDLVPTVDPAQALAARLPESGRRDILMRIRAAGRSTLAGHRALTAMAAQIAPDFALFELRAEGLGSEGTLEDLDAIASAGALRLAAQRLQARAADPDAGAHAREVAAAALTRLYALAQDAQS